MEKPRGVIWVGSPCSHLLLTLNDRGQCQAPAVGASGMALVLTSAGVSAWWDCGVREQRMFTNHQRLAPRTVTGTRLDLMPLLTYLFHGPAAADTCHAPCAPPGGQCALLLDCSAIWSICILEFYLYKSRLIGLHSFLCIQVSFMYFVCFT